MAFPVTIGRRQRNKTELSQFLSEPAFKALLLAAVAAAPVGADEVVRIVAPRSEEILFGPTEVRLSVDPRAEVDLVVVYVDDFDRPVCRVRPPEYRCSFDAGRGFQSRHLRAVARAADASVLGSDEIATLAFPKAERVEQRVAQVPVVVRRPDGLTPPPLGIDDLDCRFGGRPCEILRSEPLTVSERTPLSIVVLVDVSPSVQADRIEILEAVGDVIDTFPSHGEVLLAEFAAVYNELGPFTSNRRALRRQVQRLSIDQPHTCLLRAADRALKRLRPRAGHKLLFLISDGVETCDARFSPTGAGVQITAELGPLAHLVDVSREVAAPIYVFRLERPGSGSSLPGLTVSAPRSFEGLARETGGRLFLAGETYGLEAAFGDLIEDVSATWLVDVALPPLADDDEARRLILEADDLELRFPEYWKPEALEGTRIAMLRSEQVQARRRAAEALRLSNRPDALRELLRAVEREVDLEALRAETEALLQVAARLLVHGEAPRRRTALDVIERYAEVNSRIAGRLRAALEVYQKLDVSERSKRRARAVLAALRS